MPANFDENILFSQRVNDNSDIPIINQILRIAIYDEYHAFEFYSQVINRFGPVAPFINIVEAEKQHYSVLIRLLENYQVELPINDWAEHIKIPATLLECNELGVAAEIENIALYGHLLPYTQQADIQDIFYRLQAASYNHHLPAFRRSVITLNTNTTANSADIDQNLNAQELSKKMEQFQHLFQSILSGDIDQEELGKLLSNSNMSLMGGLLAGGFGTLLLNSMINNEIDNPEEDIPDNNKTE